MTRNLRIDMCPSDDDHRRRPPWGEPTCGRQRYDSAHIKLVPAAELKAPRTYASASLAVMW